jgi:hypothetical protein
MRNVATVALVVAIVVAIATFTSPGVAREAQPTSVRLAQEVPESLMRQKLEHAQQLLGSLSIGDFDRMISSSKELQRISLEARWSQPHSPTYAAFGEDFRAALDRIILAAERQNIDSAALNYVQVVLTCVQCHKIVREGQELALDAGGGSDSDLLERALALAVAVE